MKPVILVDIDGTIALRKDRDPYDIDKAMEDEVNWPIVHLVSCLHDACGYEVVLITAREEKFSEITEYWLWTHKIFPYALGMYMRKTADQRSDSEVKEELYGVISRYYKVEYVFDDRNSVVAMWRKLGLTCLQVADGAF